MLKILTNIWDFIAHLAWVITKIDEFIDQAKIFRDYLRGDDDIEPDEKPKRKKKK